MTEAAAQAKIENAPGTFCWIELATTDGPAAKKFYTDLFGWESTDNPMGPDMVYTIYRISGRDVAASYQKGEEMKQAPTHWACYVAVTSADETAAKAKSLGGTVVMEPFDVMEHGRMAIIADPTGAHFCVWQGKQHQGVGVKNENNALCWNELLTNDTERAKDFYTKLFGWKTKSDTGAMPYTEWINGDAHIGGMMQIQPHMGPVPPHWGLYFAVDDCDEKVERAKSLGATALVPPMDIENVGRFAVLSDPQGAVFNIIKLDLRDHK